MWKLYCEQFYKLQCFDKKIKNRTQYQPSPHLQSQFLCSGLNSGPLPVMGENTSVGHHLEKLVYWEHQWWVPSRTPGNHSSCHTAYIILLESYFGILSCALTFHLFESKLRLFIAFCYHGMVWQSFCPDWDISGAQAQSLSGSLLLQTNPSDQPVSFLA